MHTCICSCIHSKRVFWSSVVVAVQLLSCVRLFATPWTALRQASLSFTISQSLLKLMSIELVMPSNHLVLSGSLLLLPSIFPSFMVFSIEGLFASGGQSIAASFSFSISPSSEYSGLISFRIDWFDLLAIQGTLKSLLQNHSSKAWVRVVWGNFGQGKWQRFLRELGFSEISERNSEWWGYEKILRKWD